MIKVKLLNSNKGRNTDTFEPFKPVHRLFYDKFGIELLWHGDDGAPAEFKERAETSDYDYLLVGPSDFVDKSKPLDESVDRGLENLHKVTEGGDYFLWDGFDSTSIMGSYEVFEQSDAIYMFKNQLLKNREDYNLPYRCGKWFFGESYMTGHPYDIPKDKWNNIKLSGTNLGYTYMSKMNLWNTDRESNTSPYDNHSKVLYTPNLKKNIDISAVYLAETGKSYEHDFRNDELYMNHRVGAWEVLNKLNYNVFTSDHMGYGQKRIDYLDKLYRSKVALSPYGQGEICYRDIELIQLGTLMIKPDMSMVNTSPNIYVNDETYIPCKYDWSDLEEKVDLILSNYNELNEKMVYNMRQALNQYNSNNLCLHWYNIFSNLDDIKEEN